MPTIREMMDAAKTSLQNRGVLPTAAPMPNVPSAAQMQAAQQAAANKAALAAQLRGVPPAAAAPIPGAPVAAPLGTPPPGGVPPAAAAGAAPAAAPKPVAKPGGILRKLGTAAVLAGPTDAIAGGTPVADTGARYGARLGGAAAGAAAGSVVGPGGAFLGGIGGALGGEQFTDGAINFTRRVGSGIAAALGDANDAGIAAATGPLGVFDDRAIIAGFKAMPGGFKTGFNSDPGAITPEQSYIGNLLAQKKAEAAAAPAAAGDVAVAPGTGAFPVGATRADGTPIVGSGRGGFSVVPAGSIGGPDPGVRAALAGAGANGVGNGFSMVTGFDGKTRLRRTPGLEPGQSRVTGASEPGDQKLQMGQTVYDAGFARAKAENGGQNLMKQLRRELSGGFIGARARARNVGLMLESQRDANSAAQSSRQLDLTEKGQNLDYNADLAAVAQRAAAVGQGSELDLAKFLAGRSDEAFDRDIATKGNTRSDEYLRRDSINQYIATLPEEQRKAATDYYLNSGAGPSLAGVAGSEAKRTVADALSGEASNSARVFGSGFLGDVAEKLLPEPSVGTVAAGTAVGAIPGVLKRDAKLAAAGGAAGAGLVAQDFNEPSRVLATPTGDPQYDAQQFMEYIQSGKFRGQDVSKEQLKDLRSKNPEAYREILRELRRNGKTVE